MRSARYRSRYRPIVAARLGERASSSPSRMTFTFDVGRWFSDAQRIDGGEQRDDRRLVIRGRPRVQPRFGRELPQREKIRDFLSAVFHAPSRIIGVNGSRWFHAFGIDGLAVIMRVEQHRACAPGTRSSAKTSGFPSVSRISAVNPRLANSVAQQLGVAFDVVAIGRDVGNREQLDELANDLLSMAATNCSTSLRCCADSRAVKSHAASRRGSVASCAHHKACGV